jgi:hypothetical protein
VRRSDRGGTQIGRTPKVCFLKKWLSYLRYDHPEKAIEKYARCPLAPEKLPGLRVFLAIALIMVLQDDTAVYQEKGLA